LAAAAVRLLDSRKQFGDNAGFLAGGDRLVSAGAVEEQFGVIEACCSGVCSAWGVARVVR
jgi:hypothetical protein